MLFSHSIQLIKYSQLIWVNLWRWFCHFCGQYASHSSFMLYKEFFHDLFYTVVIPQSLDIVQMIHALLYSEVFVDGLISLWIVHIDVVW
jgi:hypothetical protein